MLAPLSLPESKQTLLGELTQGLEPDALNWLSGYFAGIAAAARPERGVAPVVAAVPSAPAMRPLTILYGSQTGNAQRTAKALAEHLEKLGLPTRLVRADRYATKELKDEQLLYVVISTQGDGDPPDDSLAFVEFLNSRRAPRLPGLKYAVLGLGDSSYPVFCGTALALDARLAELGAQRLFDAGTADLDVETVATPWRDKALEQAQTVLGQSEAPRASITPLRPKATRISRDNPFQAELLASQPITAPGSIKDVLHLEISLSGSQLSYQPGDALGVWPTQAETLVDNVVSTLGLDANEAVEVGGVSRPLREWLSHHRELTRLTRPFLIAHAKLSGSDELGRLLDDDARDALRHTLETRQLIDILRQYPAPWTAQGVVQALRPLAPRMYSIASSQASVEDEVHLTLANVAYDHEGEARWGVASNYLSQLDEGARLPIFIEENTRFRLPTDPARDIIMIGPGTGVAPFRAFVQDRAARAAPGRNWLFFGNPYFHTDFLYQTEWQGALADGSLHRLDLAFSRDQEEKIYVQDRLLEHGADIYQWIQGGAHVYVCGDATRMAVDVQQTLLRIASREGGLDESGARQWLDDLAAQGRYARDVY
ncbi:MAG TPA: assimilatory sulfite reductase (NADPH) flavoprotein subunit [Burkholderiaceae bacterium]|nr:assimilatory sulfite reductase (NADPH) flavoprotein subunit [Burkholderiaceae bacterium]